VAIALMRDGFVVCPWCFFKTKTPPQAAS